MTNAGNRGGMIGAFSRRNIGPQATREIGRHPLPLNCKKGRRSGDRAHVVLPVLRELKGYWTGSTFTPSCGVALPMYPIAVG